MNLKYTLAALMVAGICTGSIAQAQTTATFNYASTTPINHSTNYSLGVSTKTFYNNGQYDTSSASLTISGFHLNSDGTTKSINLFNAYSNDPNETGLGVSDPYTTKYNGDGEIRSDSFVQMDVSNLLNRGFKTLTIGVGSGQAHEGFRLYGSNVFGSLGTLLYSDANNAGHAATNGLSVTANLRDNYKYYDLIAYGTSGGSTPGQVYNSGLASIYLLDSTAVDNVFQYGGGGYVPSLAPEGSSIAMLSFGLAPAAIMAWRRRRAVK